jgi:hypothetical protein
MPQVSAVSTYTETFLSQQEATALFQELMQCPALTNMLELETPSGSFKYDFGKMMFLDHDLVGKNAFPAAIWGNNMEWSKPMLSIKKRIEGMLNEEFQTCVCIYYPDGNSGVDFHSDEIAFGDTATIPSISLGEERHFCLREKATQEVHTTLLKHGSLIVMEEGCQQYFEHSLPVDAKYLNPRINLTFRKYG